MAYFFFLEHYSCFCGSSSNNNNNNNNLKCRQKAFPVGECVPSELTGRNAHDPRLVMFKYRQQGALWSCFRRGGQSRQRKRRSYDHI